MINSADVRTKTIPLNQGAGNMPVLGFGTLIPAVALAISATRDAQEAGFDISIVRNEIRMSVRWVKRFG